MLLAEGLLPDVLKLLRSCQREASMRIVIPQVIGVIETLCYNDSVTPTLLSCGFAMALLTVASDESMGDGLIALSMRRSAVQALVALSNSSEAKLELKRRGAFQLASNLLSKVHLTPHISRASHRTSGTWLLLRAHTHVPTLRTCRPDTALASVSW